MWTLARILLSTRHHTEQKMYKEIAHIQDSDLNRFAALLTSAKWKDVKGSGANFKTSFIGEKVFFLKIPPGGRVHKHTDTPRPTETYHIPIQTNEKAVNYMFHPKRTAYHLEVGKIYWVDRNIEHESVNNGLTDRIHLLIEC